MRLLWAAAAASAMIASGLALSPASADTLAPVGKVTVTPSTGNDGTAYVDVSWASEPPDADGAVVCLHRGKTAVARPNDCESRVPVESPGMTSGLITIHPARNYVVEVFSYQSTRPPVYSKPVTRVRHGVKVTISSRCTGTAPGSTCTISGSATDTFTKASLGNRKLQLWMSREKQPAKWTRVLTRTTTSAGKVQATITVQRSRLYQWHYSSPRSHELPSNSPRVDVVVNR